jgi:glutathione S-transferase
MKGNQLLVNLLPLMTIADNQLKHHQYLAGNEFSMADIAFGVLVDKWERLNQGEGQFLNISKYYDRLLSRPHYQKHVVQFSLDAV